MVAVMALTIGAAVIQCRNFVQSVGFPRFDAFYNEAAGQ
jgi:hypothetical protein